MQSISGSSEQYNSVLPIGKWEVPLVGGYKLNADVAVDRVNGRVDYGAVIRNGDGHAMAVGVDQVIFLMTWILQRVKFFAFAYDSLVRLVCLRWRRSQIHWGLFSLSTANVIHVPSFFRLFQRFKR